MYKICLRKVIFILFIPKKALRPLRGRERERERERERGREGERERRRRSVFPFRFRVHNHHDENNISARLSSAHRQSCIRDEASDSVVVFIVALVHLRAGVALVRAAFVAANRNRQGARELLAGRGTGCRWRYDQGVIFRRE